MFTDQQNIYFASANTSEGFISYFDTIFDPNFLKDITIIKGGPGTGKSWMMRSVAEAAEKKGYTVERFLCSSDPKSLDGIIIRDKQIAIIDGTAPHSVDPKYPGAVETILNTGVFWNKEVLFANKEKIIPLIQEKNRSYKRAYQFLKATGEIAREVELIGLSALNSEKMNACIERIGKRIFKQEENAREKIRLISAFGSEGEKTLKSFELASDHIYIIEDQCYTAHAFLEELYKKAKGESQTVFKSYSPILPKRINALWFPKLRCAFIIAEKNYDNEMRGKNYLYINMRRFVASEICKANKQKLRFGAKCMEMLLSGAQDALSQAASAHQLLEKIYISAMDFKSFGKMAEELITTLLSES